MAQYYKLRGYYAKIEGNEFKEAVEKLPKEAKLMKDEQFNELPEVVRKKAYEDIDKKVYIDNYGEGNLPDNRDSLFKRGRKGKWMVPEYNETSGKYEANSLFDSEDMKMNKLGLSLTSEKNLPMPPCRHPRGSRVYQLRKLLVDELNQIAPEDGNKDNCLQLCDEDRDMLKIMERFDDLQTKLGTKQCKLASFDKDPKLKLLAAKREMLNRMSFSYLHGECEGANKCNPYTKCVNPKLIPCSGLNDPDSLLFGDEQLAGIGREIAGKQRHGDSPAARGFAANLFETNTLAPGARRKNGEPSIWVNICYPVVDSISSLSSTGPIDANTRGMRMAVKWIEANAMETAKYYTLQALDAAIRKQKRRILAVNRQMLTLQSRLTEISPTDKFGLADARYGDAIANMDLFVQNTVGGIKNQLMRRQAEKKLKEKRQELDMHMAVAPVEEQREFARQVRRMGLDKKKSRSRSRSRSKRSRSRSRSRRNRNRSSRN